MSPKGLEAERPPAIWLNVKTSEPVRGVMRFRLALLLGLPVAFEWVCLECGLHPVREDHVCGEHRA